MQRPPAPTVDLRAWFARVLRNLSASSHRASARRTYYERVAGEHAQGPSPESVGDRLEVQRMLAEAVEGLREPHRTAIYLRFYEGLAPREIAARLQVPVSTVKTRLRRGLELLRERLDASHGGDRPAWCAVLAPLVAPPSLTNPAPAAVEAGAALGGGTLTNAKLVLLAGATLATLGWIYVGQQTEDVPSADAVEPEGHLAVGSAPQDVPARTSRGSNSREPAERE